jgi:amino acid permease
MMPVFQIIEKTRTFRKLKLAGKYKIYLWRTQCVSLTSIIAMSVPKFGLFINLVGSVACTALAFVFPILIYNKAFEKEISKTRIWAHRALIIGGCICGALSFYISCYNIYLAFTYGNERVSAMHHPDTNRL